MHPNAHTEAGSRFAHLPAVFHSDGGEQITSPVYRLLSDGFYGETLWLAEEIIVTDLPPNHHMEPLNRAAAERIEAWLASLPNQSAGLKLEDLVEASYMLRPREGEPEMNHADFSLACIKLATELKARRDKNGAQMPLVDPVRRASNSKAAPMPNAQFTDAHAGMMTQQGPVQRAAQERSRRTARKPALSGSPHPDPAPGQ